MKISNSNPRLLKLIFYPLLFTLLSLPFNGCKKCEEPEVIAEENNLNQIGSGVTQEGNEGAMLLGPQLQNPYTLLNMQAAFTNLMNAGALPCDVSSFNIRVTHKYIKFKPANEDQEEILLDREDLILFDYPLDREILVGGTYYRDPLVAAEAPNFRWCCLDASTEIPLGVPYDILAELYIPELDPILIPLFNTPVDKCVDSLIKEAMRLTNNLDSSGLETRYMKKASKWTPAGRIRSQDNVINSGNGGLIPLVGAKVRANHWFETRESLTNANGNFNVLHQFRKNVDYSIKWERADFDIRSGNWGQAYFNGPCKKGDWNLDITSGLSLAYTAVHRAANRYYYLDNAGLRRPPMNDPLNNRIKIGVHDDCSPGDPFNGDFQNWRNWLTWPEVRIYKKIKSSGNCGDRTMVNIMSTTFHELAHASHWKNGTRACFDLTNANVIDGWARCAQWTLTNLEYTGLGITYNFESGYQDRDITQTGVLAHWRNGYIPFYIDLIDNFNQRTNNNNCSCSPPDAVTGFSARDVEDAIIGSKTLYQSWEKLKAQNKVNEGVLWDLFDFYNNL